MKAKRKILMAGGGLLASTLLAYAFFPRLGASATPRSHVATLFADQTGTIDRISALEGTVVEQGADLVFLEDTAEQQALEAAQAELQKVADELRASGVAIALPTFPDVLGGRIVQTRPMNSAPTETTKNLQPLPEVDGAKADVMPSSPSVSSPSAPANVPALDAAIATATERIVTCRKLITDAELSIQETQKAVETARAIYEAAKVDADRSKMLYGNGAVSANESSRKENLALQQKGIWDNNQERLTEERTVLESLKADLAAAEGELTQASIAKTTALKNPAPTTRVASNPILPKNQHFSRPAIVIPRRVSASTEPTKVLVDDQAKVAADTKLTAAKTAVDKAEEAIASRRFGAPRKLRIVKWLVTPGSNVRQGQPLCEVEFLAEVKPEPKPANLEPASPKSKAPDPAIKGNVGKFPNIEEAERRRKAGN